MFAVVSQLRINFIRNDDEVFFLRELGDRFQP